MLILLAANDARAELCLPPLFEDGSRLVSPADSRVLWLEPLLRQHEVCRREPASPGESRVFVIGSSGIFGYPHAAKDTAVAMANRSLEERGTAAHLFNLGMLWTYAPKDALILREAERYRPDAVVYAVTLDDLRHEAPLGYQPIDTFFRHNSRAVERAAAAKLPGIGEPFELYRRYLGDEVAGQHLWSVFREMGRLARVGARQVAVRARASWFPGMPAETVELEKQADSYDCAEVHRLEAFWTNWKDWSLLPWLAQMKRERGTRVLVVNWPVAADPVGDCFNARYPKANFDDYNEWLRREAGASGLAYLDLHDALAPDEFLDSIHPNAEGQHAVAARLETALGDLLASPPREDLGQALAVRMREPLASTQRKP